MCVKKTRTACRAPIGRSGRTSKTRSPRPKQTVPVSAPLEFAAGSHPERTAFKNRISSTSGALNYTISLDLSLQSQSQPASVSVSLSQPQSQPASLSLSQTANFSTIFKLLLFLDFVALKNNVFSFKIAKNNPEAHYT